MVQTTSQTAASKAHTPAADAVFHTAELLENILLYLPPNDLLLAQKVCKTWKDSVQGSKKALTALFYHPSGTDLVHWKGTGTTEPYDIRKGTWYHTDDDHRATRPVINPLPRRFMITCLGNQVSIIHPGFVSQTFNRADYWDFEVELDIGPRSARELEALHSKDASWRHMLFMQPACDELGMLCEVHDELFTISNPTGITIQNLLDGVREHWHECPGCPERFEVDRWDWEGSSSGEVDCEERAPIESAWSVLKKLSEK